MESATFAPTSNVLAALTADAGWWEKLAYQVNGLAVVFIALSLIWGVMEVIGLFFRLAARRAAAGAPKAVAAAAPATGDEPSPETVAAIAAAVAATVGPAHAIRAITPMPPDPAWAREGRREVFQSHKIR